MSTSRRALPFAPSRWLPLLLPALAPALLAGCGGDAEFRAGVVKPSQVAIAVPGMAASASGSSSGVGASSAALLGATSEYYQFTVAIAAFLNGSTAALLGLLDSVAEQTPTSRTATSRTWGPYTPGGLDPLTYRMVVSKLGANHFGFEVDARAKASTSDGDFLALLDGEVTPGASDDTGKGTMTLHFDNRRKLLPDACEQGTVAYAFDNTARPAYSLDILFTQFANANPANALCKGETAKDATYHFDQAKDGAGDFVFAIQENIHKPSENKPKLEDVSLRSRWLATGAGRADVRISGGEVTPDLAAAGLPDTAVTASQCWGGSFKTVYETSAPAQLGILPTDGDASACAFTSAMLP